MSKTTQKICSNHKVPLRLVTKLLDVEQQLQGMTYRSTIYNRINEVFSEDWRTEDEARKALLKPATPDMPFNSKMGVK